MFEIDGKIDETTDGTETVVGGGVGEICECGMVTTTDDGSEAGTDGDGIKTMLGCDEITQYSVDGTTDEIAVLKTITGELVGNVDGTKTVVGTTDGVGIETVGTETTVVTVV
jgi:hypothetical protein